MSTCFCFSKLQPDRFSVTSPVVTNTHSQFPNNTSPIAAKLHSRPPVHSQNPLDITDQLGPFSTTCQLTARSLQTAALISCSPQTSSPRYCNPCSNRVAAASCRASSCFFRSLLGLLVVWEGCESPSVEWVSLGASLVESPPGRGVACDGLAICREWVGDGTSGRVGISGSRSIESDALALACIRRASGCESGVGSFVEDFNLW